MSNDQLWHINSNLIWKISVTVLCMVQGQKIWPWEVEHTVKAETCTKVQQLLFVLTNMKSRYRVESSQLRPFSMIIRVTYLVSHPYSILAFQPSDMRPCQGHFFSINYANVCQVITKYFLLVLQSVTVSGWLVLEVFPLLWRGFSRFLFHLQCLIRVMSSLKTIVTHRRSTGFVQQTPDCCRINKTFMLKCTETFDFVFYSFLCKLTDFTWGLRMFKGQGQKL